MSRFADDRTEEVYLTRFANGIPKHISVDAHQALRLLMAARSFQDIGVIGRILRWRNIQGRYGIEIDEKWHVTFAWNESFGAYMLKLERCRSQN